MCRLDGTYPAKEDESEQSDPIGSHEGNNLMAKTHRGKVMREVPGRGRGTCPICGRTGVKIVFEITKDEATLKVCKRCKKKD